MLTTYDTAQMERDRHRAQLAAAERAARMAEFEENEAEREAAILAGPHVFIVWDDSDSWHPHIVSIHRTREGADRVAERNHDYNVGTTTLED